MQSIVRDLTHAVDLFTEVGERFLRRIQNANARIRSQPRVHARERRGEAGQRGGRRIQRHEPAREPASDRLRLGVFNRARARRLQSGMVERRLRLVDQSELNRSQDDGEQDRQRDDRLDDRGAALRAPTPDK